MRLKLSNLKTYIVAEIGWNFLGNLKLAKKMINTAKKNGADAVKLQIWDPKYLKKKDLGITMEEEKYIIKQN